jgi:hypothetical protein
MRWIICMFRGHVWVGHKLHRAYSERYNHPKRLTGEYCARCGEWEYER